MVFNNIHQYLEMLQAKPIAYTDERLALFDHLAQYIAQKYQAGRHVQLSFICTHNSRRSHMAQIWAYTIGQMEGIPIQSFSGGTEATAFNTNAIAALKKAGFQIEEISPAPNPHYQVSVGEGIVPLEAWSKQFSDPFNPTQEFAAIMTCSDADLNCPFVPGAEARIALTYEDPKLFDGTDREAQAYEERSKQIAMEMWEVFQRVKKLIH